MKLTAVTQRIDVIESRNERRDALDQRLVDFLARAGCLAAPVPNTLPAPEVIREWLARIQPEIIVLTGGDSIGVYPERDETERVLLHHARLNHLPVLGICRGMQFLADECGTSTRTVSGHVRTRHQLTGEITGFANSFHSLAIADCPPGYRVLATSEDGEIEAIGHRTLPWEGWMWHPEREPEFDDRDIHRLTRLLA